jgi:multidrug efflux pump subunit AcrA (membrane-fusion protein)
VIGLSVDLVVDIYETEPVLSIEPSAIQYDNEEQAFVYLPPDLTDEFTAKALQAENVTDVLETRDITIGFEGDLYFEISDGLKDGDSVLLYIPSTTAGSIF